MEGGQLPLLCAQLLEELAVVELDGGGGEAPGGAVGVKKKARQI